MALATRCPACHTAFRVVSDQLKLHQGLVRCGHCDHIFNGLRHLIGHPEEHANTAVSSPTTLTEPVTPTDPQATPTTLATSDTPQPRHIPALREAYGEEAAPHFLVPPRTTPAFEPQTSDSAPSAAIPTPVHAAAPPIAANNGASMVAHDVDVTTATLSIAPESVPVSLEVGSATAPTEPPLLSPTEPESTADASATTEVFEAASPNIETEDVGLEAAPAVVSESLPHAPGVDLGTEFEELPEVSFVQAAAARRQARRAPWRWVWRTLALLLCVLACAQIAWLLRSQLTLQFPLIEPYFKEACAQLSCTWTAPQHIDALVIEQSNLQKTDEGSNTYALNMTLHNKAEVAIAMPAIELSLTDLQGQLLARKVFLPQEYLGKGAVHLLRDGMPPQTEAPIRLQLELDQAALNYRVLIFYP